MNKKYELWIDVAKAFGIILVVIGHSGNEMLTNYIYWFHMPLFFLLSGLTFNPPRSKNEFFTSFRRKKIYSFIVPYISFGIVLILFGTVSMGIKNINIIETLKEIVYLVYGGQKLNGEFGVFWFVTSLLLTQVTFAFLQIYIKSSKKIIFIIAFLYIVAHIQSIYFSNLIPSIPWSMDVSMLTLTYFAVGYYLKNYFYNFFYNKKSICMLLVMLITIFISYYFNLYSYTLDLKYVEYTHLILDLYIPLTISLLICILSIWIAKGTFFSKISFIGKNSHAIMYMHLPIKMLLYNKSWFLISIAGVLISLLLNHFLQRFKIYRYLFLGINRNKA